MTGASTSSAQSGTLATVKLSNETAGALYEQRHRRKPDVDARWGTWWAAMSELRVRLVRGFVNRDRARHQGRLLEELDPLPQWAVATFAELREHHCAPIVVGNAWLEMMSRPDIAAAAAALAAGAPAADAIAHFGEPWLVDLSLLEVSRKEVDESGASRARDDTMRAFYQGVRLWFRTKKYLPTSPRPAR